MLVDRYPPASLFALVPKLMADFEPVLRGLDRLPDADQIVRQIKAELARRAPHGPALGRPSTPVEVILRPLGVKRLSGWSYEDVEHFGGDRLVLRPFRRVSLEPVPDDTTLLRGADGIAPAPPAAPNERGVEPARALKVPRGRKRRLDSTVVATTLHHPSDGGLLGDGVPVPSRLLRRATAALGAAAAGLRGALFRTRTRSVRRLAQRRQRPARRKLGLEEVEGGIVSGWRVLAEAGQDGP